MHTPGPWTYRQVPHPQAARHVGFQIDAPNGLPKCPVVIAEIHLRADAPVAICEANARLIAASPEMLAALEDAEEFMAGFEDDEVQEGINERLDAIRAAIAKATTA